jgi:hypothetical protein
MDEQNVYISDTTQPRKNEISHTAGSSSLDVARHKRFHLKENTE